ncbi:MAG TPA: PepSY-associated TM helix domain-containing protein [Novosphingobium sp.]|nr:PepSY-associated TM helix domain-containing protein [Novosphingobium sp.]
MRRAGFLSIHRWLGLVMAPFLLVQALTGAFLVIREATVAAPPSTIPSAGTFVAAAREAQPGFRVTRLFLPASTGPDAFAEMSGPGGLRSYTALDGATARPLESGSLWRFPYRAVLQLHYGLASGTAGLAVVAALGAALFLSALSGLVFWWPGLRHIPQALRVRSRLPGHARLRQWHRSAGALVAALALFSGATGVLLSVPDVIDAMAPSGGPAASAPALSPTEIDRALASAQALFPGARLRDVRFPKADRLTVNFDAPERNARAVHVVSVRPSDGVVLKAIPARDNPVLWMKVLALHTGEKFGPAGLALLLGEAAALVFLVYAGTRMWLRNRRKGKA